MVTRVQTNKRTERPFTGRDVDQGEQPHARVPAHRPLLGLTVGLAAVVHEARVVALGPGIDDPVLDTERGGLLYHSVYCTMLWLL